MENTLQHHGIRGQRWGIRRFQKKDGSLTSAGKKRYGGPEDSVESKESYEAGKQKALKSGNATEVLKYKGDLTPQEMQSALNRINWERSMKDISNKEIAENKNKADKIFKVIDTATTRVNTAAKAWNTVANVINAFNGTDSVSLPKIDTNITSGNKSTRKSEEKEQKKAEEAKKKRQEQESQKESKRKERAEKKAKAKDGTVHEGEVVGEGTKKEKHKKETVVDADWTDIPIYRYSTSDTSYRIGRDYITKLLEDMK
jgi:hypothetical protein